jgi:exodeoxyribonuclease VII large subunit
VSEQVPVYTVSEITGAVRRTLEAGYGRVRIRGEISNLRLNPSGHRYFVLKDELSQLRAVFFRGDALSLRFAPADGLEVEATGDITIYETRGELQLVVRTGKVRPHVFVAVREDAVSGPVRNCSVRPF